MIGKKSYGEDTHPYGEDFFNPVILKIRAYATPDKNLDSISLEFPRDLAKIAEKSCVPSTKFFPARNAKNGCDFGGSFFYYDVVFPKIIY